MGNCPCRDCTQRTFLCHGQCAAYQKWKTEYETSKSDFISKNQRSDFPRGMMRHMYKLIKEGRMRK